MLRTSEFVSLGHPDKIADYISQHLLDQYIKQDPNTRYAVEVQIKNNRVTLGGEVTSLAQISPEFIREHVRQGVCNIGYTREYQDRWGAANTICGEELTVETLINQQSPDIAMGVQNGWGDQGIFFGYAEPENGYNQMPEDHALAKRLCKFLFDSGEGGLDIKTQVTMDNDRIKEVIVAIPLLRDSDTLKIKRHVRDYIDCSADIIVNGTGRYIKHSSIADCGTTGRKLAVDFYGGNSKIGGGSPWTKDGSKADLTLNLLARAIARKFAREYQIPVQTAISCCIGKSKIHVCVLDMANNEIMATDQLDYKPIELRHGYKLDTPIYASMCEWGLFGEFQSDKEWEKA